MSTKVKLLKPEEFESDGNKQQFRLDKNEMYFILKGNVRIERCEQATESAERQDVDVDELSQSVHV